MRFVHTADWQIGMRAAHVGAAAARVREERIGAAQRTIDAAREGAADFVLVAGDTFENNGVDRVLVQRIADLLASFGGPVYILSGNHDPLGPGSVWEHPAWQGHRCLRILTEREPVEIPHGVLYPCPCRSKHSGADPTVGVDATGVGGITIGAAHGTVEGIQVEEKDYPIARDAAARAGLDYLALGHWHSYAPYPDAGGAVRMAYSGTHETSKFGERDSGNALWVEIDEPGASPTITRIQTGCLVWKQWEEELREAGDLGRVRERLEGVASPGVTLLDCRLSGLVTAGDAEELARLYEIADARLLFNRIHADSLRLSPSDTEWIDELPAGIIREAAQKLQAYSAPSYTGPRPPDAVPDLAARAILELYALNQETRQ